MRMLVNEAVRLAPPFHDIAILGLDEPWTGAADADQAVNACGDARIRLGLVHSPDGMLMLKDHGLDLVVCGHTHGGQVALPGGRPIIVPGAGGKIWPHGLHQVGGTPLFVSRGIGGIEIPVRAWAPPDVALFRLRG